jgi:valyl-tRNA synthetase
MDELGTDALRFTLLVGSSAGNDINLSVKKVEANRNFANKLWNAGRFIIGAIDKVTAIEDDDQPVQETLADRWIQARLRQLVTDVNRLFESFQYGEAGRQIYDFFWGEFADWYLEIAKIQLGKDEKTAFHTVQILTSVLDTCLRLLHPFTPFVTESLWGRLKAAAMEKSDALSPEDGWEDALIIARWPEAEDAAAGDESAIADMLIVQDVIRAIRNVRTEKNIKAGSKIPATLVVGDKMDLFQSQLGMIANLAFLQAEETKLHSQIESTPQDVLTAAASGITIYLETAEHIDPVEERLRIEKELETVQSQISRLEKLLNSPFAEKAPKQVVDKERERLEQFKSTYANLSGQLANLANLD